MRAGRSSSRTEPVFIDTSYVVAAINERDERHEDAMRLTATIRGRPALTTDAVLLEIGNALARRFRAAAAEIIDNILSDDATTVVHLTPNLFTRATELYRSRTDKEWGLTDCVSFVVMQDRGVTDALTHDRHFEQAGFRAMMRDSEQP